MTNKTKTRHKNIKLLNPTNFEGSNIQTLEHKTKKRTQEFIPNLLMIFAALKYKQLLPPKKHKPRELEAQFIRFCDCKSLHAPTFLKVSRANENHVKPTQKF